MVLINKVGFEKLGILTVPVDVVEVGAAEPELLLTITFIWCPSCLVNGFTEQVVGVAALVTGAGAGSGLGGGGGIDMADGDADGDTVGVTGEVCGA